ncbi:N-acylneuraminate cytidylyltransferase [Spirosomataceae bacterium TFI 002]|nr:N-acylneuraminate cytidylyltransferase [Spirosomataceae bacterium TFI 002]
MKRLAIIPARGGSKRIPRKNIKNFLGKPIIAYSIEAAIASDLFDEVMVSTDDEEISKIAKEFGAKVPFLRSSKNSDDFATTTEVIAEVLQQYEITGSVYDTVCCIYPTAPLITLNRLTEGYHLLEKYTFNSVIPVVRFSFPIQRAVKISKDSQITFFQPEHINTRSQDLEISYHDSGQFYWFRTESFKVNPTIWNHKTGAIELNQTEVQDIDTLEDWKMAELKYQMLNEDKT